MLKSFAAVPMQLYQKASMTSWYDASQLDSIVITTGAVDTWRDISGNQRHAIQTSSGNRPTSGAATINGLNVLSFAGSPAQSILPASGAFPNLSTTSATTFLVGFCTGAATGAVFLGNGATLRYWMGVTGGTTNLFANFGSTPLALNTSVPSNVTPFIGMMSYNIATSTGTFSVNNGTPLTGSVTYASIQGDVRIGGRTNLVAVISGTIGEIITFSSILDAADELSMWQYLGTKWGVTV